MKTFIYLFIFVFVFVFFFGGGGGGGGLLNVMQQPIFCSLDFLFRAGLGGEVDVWGGGGGVLCCSWTVS